MLFSFPESLKNYFVFFQTQPHHSPLTFPKSTVTSESQPHFWLSVLPQFTQITSKWPGFNSRICANSDSESVSAKSCLTLCDPEDCTPPGSSPWDFPGKNTGVGCHSLLQRIFPTQGSNPSLLHCTRILYHLSHGGSPGTN